ncbi:hypothetical protein M422DRAFT_249626 [Sphaerobolus stellatus SS14]|uniref:Unplaced genomic scaffold SPHSTscaffold_30, whole genome shotgun sequence n=1 Tax=Sphaerobolus stellatus (strain SS14) TaxID=990650 RepID=A0A0C9W3Y1_SPHS4|nr:hypothetical protein M422DRAFT_249626 [Sphaerobolus stellatus SS14]
MDAQSTRDERNLQEINYLSHKILFQLKYYGVLIRTKALFCQIPPPDGPATFNHINYFLSLLMDEGDIDPVEVSPADCDSEPRRECPDNFPELLQRDLPLRDGQRYSASSNPELALALAVSEPDQADMLSQSSPPNNTSHCFTRPAALSLSQDTRKLS